MIDFFMLSRHINKDLFVVHVRYKLAKYLIKQVLQLRTWQDKSPDVNIEHVMVFCAT